MGKIANLEAVLDGEPLAGTTGIGHYPMGHPRPADHRQRPSPCHRPGWRSSTTASSRTSATCVPSWRRGLRLRDRDRQRDRRPAADRPSRPKMTRNRRSRPRSTGWKGPFALAILFAGRHDLMIGARRGSPLAVGYGDGEMYLGSDALAPGATDPADLLSGRRRLGRVVRPGGGAGLRRGRLGQCFDRRVAPDAGPPARYDRQGRLPPLHAQARSTSSRA